MAKPLNSALAITMMNVSVSDKRKKGMQSFRQIILRSEIGDGV
jgi:hypothetical protein